MPERRRACGPLARARTLTGVAAVVLLGAVASGCQNDVTVALAAADAASYRGAHAQAEQILRRLELRLAAAEGHGQGTGLRRSDGHGSNDGSDARPALHAQVLERLAQLRALQLGDVPQALRDWTALARLERRGPRAGAALHQMADLLRHRMGQPEQAVAILQKAAELYGPGSAGAAVRRDLVATYVELGNFDAACSEAKALLADCPDGDVASDARLRLGRAQFLAQHYAAAAATFVRLADARPGKALTAVALTEAANAYQELGEPAQALSYYYAAVKDHPNPQLVQDKVARVRARIYQLEAHRTILQATAPARPRPSRR